jgi:hypothetical protein
VLHNVVQTGERTRTRSMRHSNQARELVVTDRSVESAEVFVVLDGVSLTGSSRVAQEASGRATAQALKQDIALTPAALARKRNALQARIAEMQPNSWSKLRISAWRSLSRHRPDQTC